MEITSHVAGDVTVIGVTGDLDSRTAPEAEEQVTALIEGGARKILLNLEKMDYTSSAGLRVVLATAKTLQKAGGGLRLCGLNDAVQEVFDISGFTAILHLSKTEADALAGF